MRMAKQIKVSDVEVGPMRHPALPGGFIERIKAFKEILGDTDALSLEKTIDGFKRDTNPESELIIWERIASTFHIFLSHNPTADPTVRQEIYSVLLGASMGQEDWSSIKHLTKDQVNHLVLNYSAM
jgi:hypothetical protein